VHAGFYVKNVDLVRKMTLESIIHEPASQTIDSMKVIYCVT